jgi:hypothetical protein
MNKIAKQEHSKTQPQNHMIKAKNKQKWQLQLIFKIKVRVAFGDINL